MGAYSSDCECGDNDSDRQQNIGLKNNLPKLIQSANGMIKIIKHG